jgi:glycosyltransferase involved in cell wall biosynthesis
VTLPTAAEGVSGAVAGVWSVYAAEIWPAITSAHFARNERVAARIKDAWRFAYATAFDDPRLRMVEDARDRRERWQKLTGLPAAIRRMLGADVVVTHTTGMLVLAGMARMANRRLRAVAIQYEPRPDNERPRGLSSRLRRFAYRRADRVLCMVPSIADAIRQAYGLDRKRVGWLPFGVDTDFFCPADGDPPPADLAAPYLLVPGNHRRDEDAVLDAVRADLDWPVVRVADAPWVREFYKPRLAADVALRSRVRFEHYAPAGRLRDLYRHAALTWLPLRPSGEPAGLTAALESAACGCPIAVTEGMTTEALTALGIPHVACGLRTDPGASIRDAVRNRAARARLADAVRRNASVEAASAALRRAVLEALGVRQPDCNTPEGNRIP